MRLCWAQVVFGGLAVLAVFGSASAQTVTVGAQAGAVDIEAATRSVRSAPPDALGGRRLSGEPGNAERGRAIVGSRQTGLCLLCHSGPFEPRAHQGTLAGPLQGAGARWTESQLRQRLVNPRALDPQSLMPAFHDTQGQQQVGQAYAGKPILSAQQIEDVVAYLMTLREAP